MTTDLWKKICTTFGSSKILEAKFFLDNWPAFNNEAVAGCWSLCFTPLNPDWANIQISSISLKLLRRRFFWQLTSVQRWCWSLCFTALNPDWAPAVNLSQRAKQIMWEIPRHISFFIYKVSILQLYQSGIYALSAWAELLLSFPVGTSCSNRLDFEHFDLQNPSATKSIHTNLCRFYLLLGPKYGLSSSQPFSFDLLKITSVRRVRVR